MTRHRLSYRLRTARHYAANRHFSRCLQRQRLDTPTGVGQNSSRLEQTLLLNASYEPLKIVHWQKAVTLWCQGKVEVISVYDREIRAVSISFKLPSVIRLLRYIKIKRRFDYVPVLAREHLRARRSPVPVLRRRLSRRAS